MVKTADFVVPFNATDTTTQPVTDAWALAEKVALAEPAGTVTVAGTTKAVLLLEAVSIVAAPALESVIVHVALLPTEIDVGVQASVVSVAGEKRLTEAV